jgi:hypothetical protein
MNCKHATDRLPLLGTGMVCGAHDHATHRLDPAQMTRVVAPVAVVAFFLAYMVFGNRAGGLNQFWVGSGRLGKPRQGFASAANPLSALPARTAANASTHSV